MTEFEKRCSGEIQATAKRIREFMLTLDYNELANLQHVLHEMSEEAMDLMEEIEDD